MAYAYWPDSDTPAPSSGFATWDVAQYLILSQRGYQAGADSCAFYPLWPMLLRVATVVMGGRPVLAAMVLANALSLLGLWMLYRPVGVFELLPLVWFVWERGWPRWLVRHGVWANCREKSGHVGKSQVFGLLSPWRAWWNRRTWGRCR